MSRYAHPRLLVRLRLVQSTKFVRWESHERRGGENKYPNEPSRPPSWHLPGASNTPRADKIMSVPRALMLSTISRTTKWFCLWSGGRCGCGIGEQFDARSPYPHPNKGKSQVPSAQEKSPTPKASMSQEPLFRLRRPVGLHSQSYQPTTASLCQARRPSLAK